MLPKAIAPPTTKFGDQSGLNCTRIDSAILGRLPKQLQVVGQRIQSTLEELRSLPKDKDSFGLIHGDFNDGNFTVDYTNGEITVF